MDNPRNGIEALNGLADLAAQSEAIANNARQELAAQQCLQLGIAVTRLALFANELGEPDDDPAELTQSVHDLMGQVGLWGNVRIHTAPAGPDLRELATSIDAAIRQAGMTLREVEAATGVSKSTVPRVMDGTASMHLTLKVARGLGLIE